MWSERQKAQVAQGKSSILHHESSEVPEEDAQRDSEITILGDL